MEAWQQNEGKETIIRNRKKSKESKHFIFSSIKHIHKTINTVLRKDNFEKNINKLAPIQIVCARKTSHKRFLTGGEERRTHTSTQTNRRVKGP